MAVSATHMAINLFRSHPLYAAKSIDFPTQGNGTNQPLQEQESAIYKPNYDDSIALSEEYKTFIASENATRFLPKTLQETDNKLKDEKVDEKEKKSKKDNNVNNESNSEEDFSDEDKALIKNLEKRDAEVRQHEQTHIAAGSGIVRGGASYSYQTGPDGKQYAIGGEVQIDMSPVEGDPEATIRKMQQVQRAAMAPSEPSGQDYSVASSAKSNEAAARSELTSSESEDSDSSKSGINTSNNTLASNSSKLLSAYKSNSNSQTAINSPLAQNRVDIRA